MSTETRLYRADLHIHTALSPCASDEMTPPAVVARALEAGLDMMAVSDHNAAGNIRAVQQAAEDAGGRLAVLAGMEITSAEEAHVLGLFPHAEAAEGVARELRALLSEADDHYYSFFGEQLLLAADGHEVARETVTLAWATPLDLSAVVQLVHGAGGLAVAAHVDRKAFSVFSQLGFFPSDAGFDAVEVSRHIPRGSGAIHRFLELGLPVISSSDGHFLEEIGVVHTDLRLAAPTFTELALALAERDGRSVAHA
jgi:predicted metal-dependent phosphoesterase TrpH